MVKAIYNSNVPLIPIFTTAHGKCILTGQQISKTTLRSLHTVTDTSPSIESVNIWSRM